MKFISESAGSKATPDKVIDYILDEEKVCKGEDGEVLLFTIGLDDDRPYAAQFREIAFAYGNTYGANERKYYHTKYTVSPADYDPEQGIMNITPEQLLDEATQFCHDFLAGYQSIVVIQYHDNSKSDKNLDQETGRWTDERIPNQKHLHAHIITNACPYDFELGMLRIQNKDLDAMRDYAYETGRKYHLNERYWRDEAAEKRAKQKSERDMIDEQDGIHLSDGELEIINRHGAAFATKSFKERYRVAIDEAIKEVTDFETFKDYLYKEFSIRTEVTNQGNVKFKLPDRTTSTSGKILGANYTLESIMASLEQSREAHKDDFSLPLLAPSIEAVEWRNSVMHELEQLSKGEFKDERLIPEKTVAFCQLCQDASNNANLKAALSAKERENIEDMLYYLELLRMEQEQRDKIYQRIKIGLPKFEVKIPRYVRMYDEHGRKRSILELLVMLAIVTIEDWKSRDAIPSMNIQNKPIRAYTNYQFQAMMDSIRIARELGANSEYEMELKVVAEGKKYGAIKRAYFEEKHSSEKRIEAAIKEIDKNLSLSEDERRQKIEEIHKAENQRMAVIEAEYLHAKKRYAEIARAGDTIRSNSRRVLYQSQPVQQDDDTVKDRPHRSKGEARREDERQLQEIRDWVDMAIEAISTTPDAGELENLQEWAAEMEKRGCIVRITKETISVRHPKRSNPVRLNRLGGAYEKESIINGICRIKQEYHEQVQAKRRAAEEQAYGEAIKRVADSLGNNRPARQDNCRVESTKCCTGEGQRGVDRATGSPEEIFRQRQTDGHSNREINDGSER